MTLARTAGAFYVVTIVCGAWALVVGGSSGRVANAVAGLSYVVVTVLFYSLFKRVSPRGSAAAALVGLAGCAVPLLRLEGVPGVPANPLPVFGVYCLLVAWLIARSTLPRLLAVLLALGGLGWLTFLSPDLTRLLSPYSFLPGIAGETALTLWLLATGRPVAARRPYA